MPQPLALAPCGTFTAYKRHKRRGEPVDQACAQAAREQGRERKTAAREKLAAAVRLAIVNTPRIPDDEPIDELAEARENLAIVEATMDAGVLTGMAALSKQRVDLVALIKRLETAAHPRESKLDELARRRAARISQGQV